MLSSFDHATIAVADVDAASQAYEALLGRPPLWRGAHPGLGTRAALFGLANALIELVGPVPDVPEGEGLRAHIEARGEGLLGITFGCADAAATSKLLRERKLRATAPEEGEAQSATGEHRRFRIVELSPATTRRVPVTLVERVDPIALPALPFERAQADSLDHVVLRTADPEAALALYRDGLGIRVALDRVVAGARMLFFRIGGVTLEVVHDAALAGSDVLHGLAYRVGDIEAAHARMARAGLDLSPVRTGRKPDTSVFTVRAGSCGVPTLVLRDPSRDRTPDQRQA
jgi:catechol 2,3-dioxygenase-like lactoylglutathione lyase family enzyme